MITRADVEQYVCDTLPWTEINDWDVVAIADDILAAWPELVTMSGVDADLHLGPNRVIGQVIDSDRYWQMVENRQR